MQAREICVVGGGLSGLNFAAKSSQVLGESTRVSLIEARNAAGGRTLRSAQTHSPMQELGAFFVYDKDVYDQLMSIGAQVRILKDEDFYLACNGLIEHCGKEHGPFGIIDSIASELSLLPDNISIEQALKQNERFLSLSPDMQRIIATILESDLAATLDRVGISSLRYDGQTVINGASIEDPIFGICLKEGFSSLARELRDEYHGQKNYSIRLRGVEVTGEGVVLHMLDKKRNREFTKPVDKVFLGLPLGDLRDLEYFEGGTVACKLTDKLSESQQRAIAMLDMGDAIKISVPIRGELISGRSVFNIALAPDPHCVIRCGEVWGLPMPSYGNLEPVGNPEHRQVIMMYLGGAQATALRDRLLDAKNEHANLPQLLEEWVREYLAANLGVAADRVGKVYTSMWLNDCGGRGAYSFIRADGQPSDFNPRAQFREPAFGRIYIGGSAFSEEEPTLTGGAQASAQLHLEVIQREQAARLDTIGIERPIQRWRLKSRTSKGNNARVIIASSLYEPLVRRNPREDYTANDTDLAL